MPKFLLIFEKGESVRWLGHLDILRTFERAIRRAELPIAFSNGFNPRERLFFASALSTGVTGEAEVAALELTELTPVDTIVDRLNLAFPQGIRVHRCEQIPDIGSRDILNAYLRADYEVVCVLPEMATLDVIQAAIDQLMAQSELPVTREREGRVKSVDIRPGLYALELLPDRTHADRLKLSMSVALGESGNTKPSEVIATLAQRLPGLAVRRIHRKRLLSPVS